MKKLLPLFFLLASLSIEAADTLRYYQPGRYMATSYSSVTYPKQIARFEPKAPATIKSIVILMSGTAGGTATVRLFGHEGGTAHPQLQADLVAPITITKKTNDALERVEILLDTAHLRVENNQFFVAVSNMVNVEVRVAQDPTPPACRATPETGGDYLFTTGENALGQWTLMANRPLVMDVVVEYDELPAQPWFADVDVLSGIKSGKKTDGNVAFGNINTDSYLDVLLGKRLYRNNGNGTFAEISATAGIDYPVPPAANLFIDMDNDGDDDVLFLSHDPLLNILYLNNGAGAFTKTPLTMPVDFEAVTSFSVADVNTDGFPDLFVGQLWQPYGVAMPNYLLYNNKSLGFSNQTSRLAGNNKGFSRGSQWVDYDNDNDLDLFVANYAASLDRNTSYDNFFRNNGDGTFENIIDLTPIDNNGGTLFYNMSTGCDWADYDNDGDMDLLHSNFSHPRNMPPVQYQAPWGVSGSNITVKEDTRMTTLFENEGAPNYTFKDLMGQVSQRPGQISATGLQFEETHAGAAFGDLNNDGRMDIITTTFYPCNFNDVYIQQPDKTFALKSFHYKINRVNGGENPVFADYDNDGMLDVMVGNGGNFRFFKNTAPHGGNFISIDLKATTGNKKAIGARVWVWAEGKAYMQDVTLGRGINSQKPLRLFFGLNEHKKADSVVVRWPGNTATESFNNVTTNTLNILTEGGQVALAAKEAAAQPFRVSVGPNPFSSNICFNFELSSSQNVQLQITDIVGREVYTATSVLDAGNRQLQWNAETLPAGIYTYRLQTRQGMQSGTLVKL